jgi:lipopolysaccharide export system permease protein
LRADILIRAVLILERYIIREISTPLVGICTVLIMIFAGYSAVRFLNDAVNGLLSGGTVVTLVALKVIIAFEVLLPVTLYLAVVLALGRLHADCEITAMEACGIGQGRIIASIFLLALPLALVVTGLSLYARPWAYAKFYALEASAQSEFDFAKVEPGRFYELGDDVVFFAQELDAEEKHARNVWIWEIKAGKREVTSAESAYQVNGPEEGQKAIVIRNGYHCVLNLKTGADSLIRFQENVLQLEPARTPPSEFRRKAAPTTDLARSQNPQDIAEFQWRLSTGLTTLLMSLLAIPLSRVAPRRSKYGKVTAAIILFFVFYHLDLIAKTWVEKQVVGALPGIWWVTSLLAALVLLLLPEPNPFRHRLMRRFRIHGGMES